MAIMPLKTNNMTAVEWILIELQKNFPKEINNAYNANQLLFESLFQQAKAIEKKQIENAHLSGLLRPLEMEATKQAEQYYNNTYLTTRLSDSSNNIQIIK